MKLHHLCLTLLMLFPLHLYGKHYHITETLIEIRLQKDGSMLVEETRNFAFEGSFREAFRIFPVTEGVQFSDFQVFENDQPWPLSTRREQGNFRIRERRNQTEVQWFFRAHDTRRRFSIRFRVQGAVERYEDAAVLYYMAIAPEWEVSQENVRITIYPPAAAEPEPMHWWHGPPHITSVVDHQGIITADAARIPASSLMEIRALYPSWLFEDLPLQTGNVVAGIVDQEEERAREAERQRLLELQARMLRQQQHARGRILIIPLALAYGLLWLWVYRRYGKSADPETYPARSRSMPSKEKPAYISYLMHHSFTGMHAMLATLFHLASRGFVTITQQAHPEKKGKTRIVFERRRQYLQQHQRELETWENDLLTFLFDRISEGKDKLDHETLKKKSSKVQSFFQKWMKQIRKEAAKLQWFDPQNSRNLKKAMMISGSLMALSVPLIINYGPAMVILLMLGLGSFTHSIFFRKRTEAGELEYRKWKNLRKYLDQHPWQQEPWENLPENISDYLIYGIALGLGNQYVSRLTSSLDNGTVPSSLGWIVVWQAQSLSTGKIIHEIVSTSGSAIFPQGGGGTALGGGGGISAGGGGAR